MPNLTIQGHKFEVPEAIVAKYAVGYALTDEGEAHALRQTLMENLRNNFAPKIKVAQGDAETLTDEQVAALQAEFNTYAEGYKFGVRTGGTGSSVRLDPLTREMLNLAKEDFRKAYVAKFGEKPEKDLVAERAEQLIDKRKDDYMRRARAIIRQKEGADGSVTLEALGL